MICFFFKVIDIKQKFYNGLLQKKNVFEISVEFENVS